MAENRTEISYVEGNRKHKLVKVNQYLFERNKPITLGVSYRCINFRFGCPTKLHVLENGSFLYGIHNHAPSIEKVSAREIISEGKRLAKESPLATSAQISNRIETLATEQNLDGTYLGSTESLKRRIGYTKFKAHGSVNLGDSLSTIIIPPSKQLTVRGDQFLIYDNNQGENPMLVFDSRNSLNKLSYCETWLIDGTFKSAPSMFAQIYTVHGIYANTIALPFVYAYLAGKSEETYREFFNVVRNKTEGEPQCIISDFEVAAINACRATYLTTQLNGCLFHLTQNIFRHVQQIPSVLNRHKSTDADGVRVRTAIRSLGALSFMRSEEFFHVLSEVRAQFLPTDPIRAVFSYFQDSYMGYKWGDVRFPITFWNVRSRFENKQPRTNNSKEGWHYRFNNQHSKSHPTLDTSLTIVRNEERHWFIECEKMDGGIIPKRKRRSRDVELRLENIITNQGKQKLGNHVEFLKAIQTCLHEFLVESGD